MVDEVEYEAGEDRDDDSNPHLHAETDGPDVVFIELQQAQRKAHCQNKTHNVPS